MNTLSKLTYPNKHFLGFEDIVDMLTTTSFESIKYPPTNIYKSEDSYVIELAVAGFGKENLNVNMIDNILIVEGGIEKSSEKIKYIHNGISSRKFKQEFVIDKTLELVDTTLTNGILKIEFIQHKPKINSKKIEIN